MTARVNVAGGFKTEAAQRAMRSTMQRHTRLLRRAIALPHVAAEAGSRHVLPGVRPTSASRYHVVDRELADREQPQY